mgnify:CR=1 FL=1
MNVKQMTKHRTKIRRRNGGGRPKFQVHLAIWIQPNTLRNVKQTFRMRLPIVQRRRELQQAIKLLQLSNLELSEYIEGELEKNDITSDLKATDKTSDLEAIYKKKQ